MLFVLQFVCNFSKCITFGLDTVRSVKLYPTYFSNPKVNFPRVKLRDVYIELQETKGMDLRPKTQQFRYGQ